MIFKKESKIVKFFGCLGMTMYSYLCIGFYGEEIIFHQTAKKDTKVGYYLRSKFLEELPDHHYARIYHELNQNYNL